MSSAWGSLPAARPVRLTKRGRVAAWSLVVGAAFGSGASAQLWDPYTRHLHLVTYEDGSGVLLDGGHEVAQFEDGVLPWDCRTMGNRICGGQVSGNGEPVEPSGAQMRNDLGSGVDTVPRVP